jgi:hypothetical protein
LLDVRLGGSAEPRRVPVGGHPVHRRLRRGPKLILALILVVAALAATGVASAACDARMGSQFSNSSPLINITANNGGNFPGHITVGQYSWGTNGGVANLGGGYYKQQYTFLPGWYVVGSSPVVQFVFPSSAGACASYVFSRHITVVA